MVCGMVFCGVAWCGEVHCGRRGSQGVCHRTKHRAHCTRTVGVVFEPPQSGSRCPRARPLCLLWWVLWAPSAPSYLDAQLVLEPA